MTNHPSRGSIAKQRDAGVFGIITTAACMILSIGCLRAEEKTEMPMLVGLVKPAQILKIAPEWKAGYEAYTPDASALAKIREAAALAKGEIRIEVVLGSWCGDSLDQVPRFIKIHKQLSGTRIPAVYVGVDRAKKDPDGRTASLNIERVPTFIVYWKSAEIGRIIETPKTTVEADLAEILSHPGQP